jgi:hypothetical protein
VKTFSRGLISDSAIPFAANPWKIAGKLVNDCPETARLSDSSPEAETLDSIVIASSLVVVRDDRAQL